MLSEAGPGTRGIGLIMLAVLAWGGLLALGAYRYNLDPRKAVIVLGCVGTFLGLWGLLLAGWSQRSRGGAGRSPDSAGGALEDRSRPRGGPR